MTRLERPGANSLKTEEKRDRLIARIDDGKTVTLAATYTSMGSREKARVYDERARNLKNKSQEQEKQGE